MIPETNACCWYFTLACLIAIIVLSVIILIKINKKRSTKQSYKNFAKSVKGFTAGMGAGSPTQCSDFGTKPNCSSPGIDDGEYGCCPGQQCWLDSTQQNRYCLDPTDGTSYCGICTEMCTQSDPDTGADLPTDMACIKIACPNCARN